MPTGPILLFPGIMGSRLYFPAADRFWDPDSNKRMLWWAPVWPVRSDEDNRRDLRFEQPAGVVIDPLGDEFGPAEADRGWGGVVWSYYGEMLGDLRTDAAGEAYAAGYDWRQGIKWLGEFAATRIRRVLEITGAARLAVVTHSMGGLVVRAAFQHFPELRDRVARVVHVCQPSAGAVILYRRLFTGLLRPFDGGGAVADRAFRLIHGNTRASILGNVSGLPGAMQLLPSPHYPAAGGRVWNPSLPNPPTYTSDTNPPGVSDTRLRPGVSNDLIARVGEVNEFHAWLGDPTNPATSHPDTWLIYGADLPTETTIAFDGTTSSPAPSTPGTAVVPAVSATALGLPPGRAVAFTNLTHASACNAAAVRSTVREILAAP